LKVKVLQGLCIGFFVCIGKSEEEVYANILKHNYSYPAKEQLLYFFFFFFFFNYVRIAGEKRRKKNATERRLNPEKISPEKRGVNVIFIFDDDRTDSPI
jgi:hypothetical protein